MLPGTQMPSFRLGRGMLRRCRFAVCREMTSSVVSRTSFTLLSRGLVVLLAVAAVFLPRDIRLPRIEVQAPLPLVDGPGKLQRQEELLFLP